MRALRKVYAEKLHATNASKSLDGTGNLQLDLRNGFVYIVEAHVLKAKVNVSSILG